MDDQTRKLPATGVTVTTDSESMQKYDAMFSDMDRHYECLMGTVPGVVYTLDEKGHFTYLNDHAANTIGFSRDDLIGRHFSAIIHPGDLQSVSRDFILPRFSGVPTGNERAPKLFDERRTWPRRTDNLQMRVQPKPGFAERDDVALKCKVNASGQYDRENRFRGTVGIMYEITKDDGVVISLDRRGHYNAFELLTQALSHVFSNVFTGIYGNLQLIEMQLERPESFRGNIEAIKHSVENAVTLIRKLAKTVSSPAESSKVNLEKVLRGTADELLESKYRCSIGNGLWQTESDPDYIRHIIRALYFHIARSMRPEHPVDIAVENIHEATEKLPRVDCKYILVTFAFSPLPSVENGTAIDEFSSLERIASMALSYELLKKIGGKISVSTSDHRSSVQLYLPAVPAG
jgi:PAS domain-containing protein